jgi:hypothetical protein
MEFCIVIFNLEVQNSQDLFFSSFNSLVFVFNLNTYLDIFNEMKVFYTDSFIPD